MAIIVNLLFNPNKETHKKWYSSNTFEAFHGVTLFEGALFVAFSKDLYVWIHKNHKDLTCQEYINDNI